MTPESVEAGLELSRADRRLVQLGLAAQGFDPGPADGLIGRGTRGAIGRWQTSRGEASTGYLDAEAAKLLLASGRTREAAEQARRQAEAEAERQRRHQDSQTGARREPKCAELSEDGECWKEIVNQSGCFIWDHLNLNVTVHWSGACNDGVADGEGTLTRETTEDWDWYPIQETGRFVNGAQHGPWASRDAEGDVQEGPYVEGKRHGQWVFRDAEGDVQEGPYVDGKRHGQWAFRDAEGDVQEGPYVDGEKHGNWVESYSYRGNVEEGPYVEGKRHGQWMFRDADGHVYGGSYVNGVKHGRWLERGSEFLELAFELEESVFGAEEGEGPYVDGKWHGHWMIRNANGDVSEGPFVNGVRHGLWVIRGLSIYEKSEAQGSYVDGKRHGRWVESYDDPDMGKGVREGPYVDGMKHGHWVERSDGFYGLGKVEAEGSYVNDKREGRWLTRWDKPEGLRVETQTCVAGACN